MLTSANTSTQVTTDTGVAVDTAFHSVVIQWTGLNAGTIRLLDANNTHDASSLFRKGKEVAQKRPDIIITDGLAAYERAHMKEYWTKEQPRTKHIRHITLKGDRNNNKMERINGEIRDREKVMRGLKKKDTVMLSGYKLFHNYIRSHMGLDGDTPADRAGIKIEGDNKWITIIQNASKQ